MRSKLPARVALPVVLCTPVAASEARPQNIYGALVGNVTDSSGAAVPGATVTATQIETNLKNARFGF
jgi:hypothetical protein